MRRAKTRTEKVSAGNIDDLIELTEELAHFEHLDPPDEGAKRRLRDHALSPNPPFEAFVHYLDGRPVGYITYYFTYSTFLAMPTLFLEDIFVLEEFRNRGVGKALFLFCAKEALAHGCGRMEWSVLTWNKSAIQFYERMGGERLGWYFYRLDEGGLKELVGKEAR